MPIMDPSIKRDHTFKVRHDECVLLEKELSEGDVKLCLTFSMDSKSNSSAINISVTLYVGEEREGPFEWPDPDPEYHKSNEQSPVVRALAG
ncbi:unnamed protein product, partial [Darwinula stevensoni]